MDRTVMSREEIPADLMQKFERMWDHSGGDSTAAIVDNLRIVSWHKNRKSAQSALSRYNSNFSVR